MPMVNGKKLTYTEKGKKMAKDYEEEEKME